MNTRKHYKLPHELGQALIDYLQRQPWAEVDAFIRGLQSVEPIEDEKQAIKPQNGQSSRDAEGRLQQFRGM